MVSPTIAGGVGPEEAGRAEAEAFDRHLQEIEATERTRRLGSSRGATRAAAPSEYQALGNVDRLRERLNELVAFRKAVHASTVWRVAQLVRSLFGRAW